MPAEKLDRRQPGHRLFRRDGKTLAPQQRGKAEKGRDMALDLGHACAS